jgi:heme/copper-type cytochrome/quinol oxidase subunit 2
MRRISTPLRIFACVLALAPVSAAIATTFAISPNTNSGNPATYKWFVSIDGAQATNNPPLTVLTGQTYNFNVTTSIAHPFWIDQVAGIGSLAHSYPPSGGLSENGVTSNTSITMNLPADAPDTLYYACGNHISMNGTITVVHDLVFRASFD